MESTRKRDYLILTAVYAVGFLLFFTPFDGLSHDPIFYYGYLSSVLFDADLRLLNDAALAPNLIPTVNLMLTDLLPNGNVRNVFAIGSPLLWLPFFFPVRAVGWVLNAALSSPPAWVNDRYSLPYLWAVSAGTMVYGYLALILIYEALRRIFRPGPSMLAALSILLATPLALYALRLPAMSHATSAFSVALVIFLSLRYRGFRDWRHYALIGAALGLAALTRWQNVLYGLLPFALWLEKSLRRENGRSLSQESLHVAAGGLAFLAVFSIQAFYWKAVFGTFLTVPQSEGFMLWGNPKILEVLFSGWHGLYYVHPILLIATAGLLLHAIENRRRVLPWALILSFLLLVYVNACVRDWWQGASFGGRRFVSGLPVLAFGLAAVYDKCKGRYIVVAAILSVAAIAWNLFLQAAYTRGMFDEFLYPHLWAVRRDMIAALPRFLGMLPLESYAWTQLYFGESPGAGIAVLAVGLGLIALLYYAIRSNGFRILEKRLSVTIAVLAGLMLGADAFMVLRSPGTDRDGMAFRRAQDPSMPQPEKRQTLERLVDSGYPNPVAYYQLAKQSGDPDTLSRCLDAVRTQWPHYWAQWLFELPESEREESESEHARQILEPVFLSAHTLFCRRFIENSHEGALRAKRRWLKRALRFNPIDPHWLNELRLLYGQKGDYARAHRIEKRMHRVVPPRPETILAGAAKVPAEDTVFLISNNRHAIASAAEIARQIGDMEKALAWFDGMAKYGNLDAPLRQARLYLQLQADDFGPGEVKLAESLDDPQAEPRLFVEAAKREIRNARLEGAIEILQRGLRRFPEDPTLVYRLRQVLAGYGTDAVPFDVLLDADIDSCEYWIAVCERLNDAHRYEETVKRLKPYIERGVDRPWAHFIYGCALLQLEEFAKAEEALRTPYAASPDSFAYAFYLAQVLLGQNRNDEALEAIRPALDADPDNPDLKNLESRIEEAMQE